MPGDGRAGVVWTDERGTSEEGVASGAARELASAWRRRGPAVRASGANAIRLSAAALAVVLLTALAGCGTARAGGGTPATTDVPSPFAACPVAAVPSHAPTEVPGALPPITLPCFADAAPVTLRWLGRPAVVNLWASYCGPCRTELPELQRFGGEAPGVTVIGVATGDQRSAAAWAGQDLGVRFPSLDDPQRRLLSALGRNALPLTLFVDANGVVRHEDASGALTLAKLRALAARYLDVS